MSDLRLGDDLDDYCVKCRRLTNHSIVSMLGREPAKVRCRTCYNDHDYRRGEPPPGKRDAKKETLFREVLSSIAPDKPAPEAAEKARGRRKDKSAEP